MVGSSCRSLVVALAVLTTAAAGEDPEEPGRPPAAVGLRVESVLESSRGRPLARSLTLFRDGVAWDFLEMPDTAAGKQTAGGGMKLVDIVLHDPVRERVVVIDPVRNLRTEIPTVRLERLGVSLAKWARSSDDRLVRWAGGPDFTEGLREAQGTIELSGPRARYAVRHVAASSPEEARTYRQFADTAILLKALLQPGGVPPFPRLAINRRLEEAGALPAEVTLEIEPRGLSFNAGATRLRVVHKSHPRILAEDLDRIEEAEAHLATSAPVDLAEFAADRAAPPAHPRQDDRGS